MPLSKPCLDRPELDALVERAKERWNAMTPEEREAHLKEQRASWVRANWRGRRTAGLPAVALDARAKAAGGGVTRFLAALLLAWPAFADGIRIVDGDSFVLGTERIRIANIDAPEMRCRCPSECALAEAATETLRSLLAGDVVVRVVRVGADRYGRSLALVEVNGVDVGETLVEMGLARKWAGRREAWC